MTTLLYSTAKEIGDNIITISESLDEHIEKWSDVSARPDGLGITECVGFTSKESAESDQPTLVVDVQAPSSSQEAQLRIWAIKTALAEDQTECFDNIQLTFSTDYSKARLLAQKGSEITRGDLRALLHDPDTRLERLVVSNHSGIDASSRQVGERYDLTADEIDSEESVADKVSDALRAVLSTLKSSAKQ